MKKFYPLFLFAVVCVTSQAQLTQANHAPVAGETYTMMEVNTTSIEPGASGAGAVWNFGSATVTSVPHNYTVASSTDPNYPAGVVAVGYSSSNINYVKSSSSDLSYYGGPVEVQTIKATFNYSAPAVWAAYPMSLNTTSSSVIGGTVIVTAPTSASGTFTGSSSVIADGSGTLILTTGTFTNVLRVKTTQTIDFSVAGGIITGKLVQETFEYYGGGKKAPLFSIQSGTMNVGTTPSSDKLVSQNKDAVISTPVALKEISSSADVRVYPQPASDLVTIEIQKGDASSVEVFDITGKKVQGVNVSAHKAAVNVSQYAAGVYFYNVLDKTGEVVSTGKFAVTR